MGSAGLFRFKVLVAMKSLPLHAHNADSAQTILGPCCANVEVVRPWDVADDDDLEIFVTAWCWHPRYIPEEQIVFIPEPPLPGVCEAARSELPGLHYLVRLRLIAYQDWYTLPPSPAGGGAGRSGGASGHMVRPMATVVSARRITTPLRAGIATTTTTLTTATITGDILAWTVIAMPRHPAYGRLAQSRSACLPVRSGA